MRAVDAVRGEIREMVQRISDTEVKVDLVVEKERRDRAREGARFSFARSASIFDPEVSGLDKRLRDPTADDWTPLGRDTRFEAYLLGQIKKRLSPP